MVDYNPTIILLQSLNIIDQRIAVHINIEELILIQKICSNGRSILLFSLVAFLLP